MVHLDPLDPEVVVGKQVLLVQLDNQASQVLQGRRAKQASKEPQAILVQVDLLVLVGQQDNKDLVELQVQLASKGLKVKEVSLDLVGQVDQQAQLVPLDQVGL